MSERFGGYTTKTYNLLALTLMEKNDIDRAAKIYENALNELNLSTEEGQTQHLTAGNTDLACMIFNYIKCLAIKNGQGEGMSYFKSDAMTKQLLGYLVRMESPLGAQFVEERTASENLFDQAVQSMA